MANLNDYKKHIQVLKMEQKIGRIQKELETVNYGDECPLHGENDCAEVRKAYDRGYVNGLYEALTFFKLIEADTPQTESTGSPIGDYRDGVGAWQTENIPTGCSKSWSAACTYCERYFSCDYLSGRHTDCGWGEPK